MEGIEVFVSNCPSPLTKILITVSVLFFKQMVILRTQLNKPRLRFMTQTNFPLNKSWYFD